MNQLGWVKMHRSMLDWEWYSDINVCRLFMHMILKANHKDGKWRGILINRGQTLTSLNTLESETGLSKSQIRTAIKKLISTREIAQQSHSQHTVFTVINYDSYQGDDTQSSIPVTSGSHTSDTRVTSNNNNKNKENEKNKDLSQSEIAEKEAIPVKEIVAAYNEICTNLPEAKTISSKQKRIIWLKARWREQSASDQNLDWWRGYFDWCNKHPQLTGQQEGFNWIASLEDLVNASKFQRLTEKGSL